MICGLSVCCQFCKLQEQDTLKDLYNQDDDHQELANYYVTASYREKVRNNPVSVSPSTCLITYFVLGQTKPRPLTWTMRDLCVCLSLWSESKADQIISWSKTVHEVTKTFTCLSVCLSLQRLDSRLSLLQSAVDEYNKAKNEFAAKVNLVCGNYLIDLYEDK